MIKFLFSLILSLLLPLVCRSADKQWASTAKLQVGGAEPYAKIENGEPTAESVYATGLELLQSPAILDRGHALVRSLHPELPAQPCKLEAARLRGTRIIVVRVVGPEPAYAKTYLDAVIDAFVAKRKETGADGGQGELPAVMEDLSFLEKEIPLMEQRIKASEQSGTASDQNQLVQQKAKLERMKTGYEKTLVLKRKLQEQFKDQPRNGVVIRILENASIPILLMPGVSLPALPSAR